MRSEYHCMGKVLPSNQISVFKLAKMRWRAGVLRPWRKNTAQTFLTLRYESDFVQSNGRIAFPLLGHAWLGLKRYLLLIEFNKELYWVKVKSTALVISGCRFR